VKWLEKFLDLIPHIGEEGGENRVQDLTFSLFNPPCIHIEGEQGEKLIKRQSSSIDD
jgi:hypothetical protein